MNEGRRYYEDGVLFMRTDDEYVLLRKKMLTMNHPSIPN